MLDVTIALSSAGEVALLAIFSTFSAALVALLTRMGNRADKRMDWARQDQVAERLENANRRTHTQLSRVEGLVDGGLTAQMRREIVAYKGHLVFMRAKLNEAGAKATDEEKTSIREMEGIVVDLQKSLDEREALIRANAAKAKEVALIEAANPSHSISADVRDRKE